MHVHSNHILCIHDQSVPVFIHKNDGYIKIFLIWGGDLFVWGGGILRVPPSDKTCSRYVCISNPNCLNSLQTAHVVRATNP